MRWAATLAVMMFVAAPALAPAPALAIDPPQIPPGPPPTGPVAPLGPTEQKATCGVGAVLPGSQFQLRPSAAVMLNYAAAWRFSTGVGQKVAVIDTGV
jgi:membrane-anchored mycosin MYCP